MAIAIITGASRGLGKSMALCLAGAGHDILLTYHSKADEARAVAAEVEALGRKAAHARLDVSQCGTFPAFADTVSDILGRVFGRPDFDFLVNNAGIGIHASFMDTTEEQFDRLAAIHLKAAFFLSQRLVPLMRDGGGIVNVSTGLARFSLPGYAAYAAMKGGVEVLTRYMARELGGRGITVNTIAPGAVETDFDGGAVRDNEKINAFIAANTALGRVGLPEDIGGAMAMLLSPGGRWITGQRIEVSGGMFL